SAAATVPPVRPPPHDLSGQIRSGPWPSRRFRACSSCPSARSYFEALPARRQPLPALPPAVRFTSERGHRLLRNYFCPAASRIRVLYPQKRTSVGGRMIRHHIGVVIGHVATRCPTRLIRLFRLPASSATTEALSLERLQPSD